ncbi:MAG: sugar ABC transporter substrate-binding protein [Spirochaetaceae bacterium]|nr:sugar ABC transporter substrate-binding protein [Spirochaetaceae bacterium]
MKKLFACLVAVALAASVAVAQQKTVVQYWYHLDNANASIDDLIQKFEKENPTIDIVPERVPWGSYNQKLLTSVAAGNAPDVFEVKLWWQPQLVEMGAMAPIDGYLANWPLKSDIFDNVWKLSKFTNGRQYLMPYQMVILYLYYRTDLFKAAGLQPPKTREEFLDAARKLTKDGSYGFGMRGASGGHDFWATFVLSSGAQIYDASGKTALTTQAAIEANQWYIDLFTKWKVSPPTAPADGFKETIANMKSGKTAMTIHHFGSSAEMDAALGDKISAAPVPAGLLGSWTSFGDGELAIWSGSKVKDAAWKWLAFIGTAENNALWQKASGQVSINVSNGQTKEAASNRFMKATVDSAAFATILPAVPAVNDFVGTVWPANMQRALMGEITSAQMMKAFEDLFSKK